MWITIATMAFSMAMIAASPDILNCSGKQHDPLRSVVSKEPALLFMF